VKLLPNCCQFFCLDSAIVGPFLAKIWKILKILWSNSYIDGICDELDVSMTSLTEIGTNLAVLSQFQCFQSNFQATMMVYVVIFSSSVQRLLATLWQHFQKCCLPPGNTWVSKAT
jgi:hypothetical protein